MWAIHTVKDHLAIKSNAELFGKLRSEDRQFKASLHKKVSKTPSQLVVGRGHPSMVIPCSHYLSNGGKCTIGELCSWAKSKILSAK
jgi:hypothetical protein